MPTAFLLLIISQALHSIEEYFNHLWVVLTPARSVSGFFSDDLQSGFAIANTLIVLAGVLCYLGPIRNDWRGAAGIAWFWAVIEFSNGVGHSLFALEARSYFPGVYTAPLLLVFSGLLACRLLHSSDQGDRPGNTNSNSGGSQ
jgi:hypothetical protein